MNKDFDQELSKLEDRYKKEVASKINDPFALQINWTHLKRGGNKFQTYQLVQVNHNRMEFKVTSGAKLFYLSFLVVGLGILLGLPYFTQSSEGLIFDGNTIIVLLIAFAFMIAGGCLYYFGTIPIVFDKRSGHGWKGKKVSEGKTSNNNLKHFFKLKNIHALQLLSKHIKSGKKAYYSYELNIVLKDKKRVNLVDHGRKDEIEKDAKSLSNFLGKPVWKSFD